MNRITFIKKFFSYVVPAILSFILIGVYSVVDGFFVGNKVGDIGLSAINVAFPLVAVMIAVGTGIGMGGSVNYSIRNACGDRKGARQYVGCTVILLIAMSILLTVVNFFFSIPLVALLGAEGELLTMGAAYLKIVALGAVAQVMATGCIPLIRNDGGATYAMITTVSGFAVNILLDYIFVWKMELGVEGAAAATAIAQMLTLALGVIYLLVNKMLSFKHVFHKAGHVFYNIVKIGISPFGISLIPNVFLVLVNGYSIIYGGERAVACYAVISYIVYIAYMIIQAVGDGSQPMMSRYYGKGDFLKLSATKKLAFFTAAVLGIISMILLYATRYQVGVLLGASPEVVQDVGACYPIFINVIPLIVISRVAVSFFYATEKSTNSYIVTYIEPVLLLAALWILPVYMGQWGVWWSVAAAQGITGLIAFAFMMRDGKTKEKIIRF